MIKTLTAADIPHFALVATESYHQAYKGLIPAADIDTFAQSSFTPNVVEQARQSVEIKLLWQGEQIVGYNWLEPSPIKLNQPLKLEAPRPLYLRRLYLLSEYTGQGLGLKLLQDAIKWGQDHAFTHLWLTVWDKNPKAEKFYGREGFATIGDCDFWCGQTHCRDWVMIRSL